MSVKFSIVENREVHNFPEVTQIICVRVKEPDFRAQSLRGYVDKRCASV